MTAPELPVGTLDVQGPKDHLNVGILHSVSKAQDKRGFQKMWCVRSLCVCILLGPSCYKAHIRGRRLTQSAYTWIVSFPRMPWMLAISA